MPAPPSPRHDQPLSERRARLEALLLGSAPLWRASTFHEPRPAWCVDYPQLTAELLALDESSLAYLSERSSHAAAWLLPALPQLRSLPELSSLSAAPSPAAVGRVRYHGVSARKSGQIDAFASAVGRPQARLVEWCAGRGHLGRRFLVEWGGEAVALERDAALCASGAALCERISRGKPGVHPHPRLRFITADVMAESSAASLRGAHAIALHACGDLHRRLVEAAVSVRAPAIDVAPCCYQLTAAESYRPLATGSELRPDRNALKLAVTETITASPRKAALSVQASAWKLAFLSLRDELEPGAAYRPFRPVPASWQHGGFADFLIRLAAREAVHIPTGYNFGAAEATGWQRHHESRRLQLVRLSFRRALEIWLLCDLGDWLEQQGYTVTLREFCHHQLTPRNLLLSARLQGGSGARLNPL